MKPKITLYSNTSFNGRKRVFTDSCSNMLNVGFDQTAVSVKVDGGVWVLFQNHEYTGKIWVVMQGDQIEYLRWFNKMARSIKLLDNYDFYAVPEIKIFSHTGDSLTLHNDVPNLQHYGYLRKVSAVEVVKGAWVGYDGRGYNGKQTLFLKGNYQADNNKDPFHGRFADNGGISALRKIQLFPTGPLELIRIEYNLKNATIHAKPVSVFQWTQTNNTFVTQTVTRTEEHTITKENTYEFRWDYGLKISTLLEVTAGIPQIGVGSKLEISVEQTLNIGSSHETKISKTQKWSAEYPTTIPAKSMITLTSKLREGHFSVPYTAVFCRGADETHTEKQHGTFFGVQFYDFNTEFKQKILAPTLKSEL